MFYIFFITKYFYLFGYNCKCLRYINSLDKISLRIYTLPRRSLRH